MYNEIQMAGFGGQGVMVMGQVVCYAGLEEGLNVSWFPSYGAEMRGGTANCAVVVSDEPIGSPVIGKPDIVIVMNNPSLLKFESSVKPGGKLFINSSLVDRKPTRTDIDITYVDANMEAEKLGNAKISNMVMLGAVLEKTKLIPLQAIKDALKEHLPARNQKYLPMNYACLDKGAEIAKAQ